MKGLYPAVFKYDDVKRQWDFYFPDFEEIIMYGGGFNLYEAFWRAEDIINSVLYKYELLKKDIKRPSNIQDIELKSGEEVHLIRVNTKGYMRYQKIISYLQLQQEIAESPEIIPVPLN